MTTYFKQGIEVRGNAKIIGHTEITGSTIVGDLQSEDLLAVNSRITTDLIPHLDCAYDLGSENLRWKALYAKELYLDIEEQIEGGILFVGADGKFQTSFDFKWDNDAKALTANGSLKFTGEDNTYQLGDVVIEDNTISLANSKDQLFLLTDSNQTLTVGGNLEVLGETISVSTSNTAFLDPIITLGGADSNTILTADDPYDRGVEYLCYDEQNHVHLRAENMVLGERYVIELIGGDPTDFVALGADRNVAGELFTASEVAMVVGTEVDPSVPSGTITINGVDVRVNGISSTTIVADINEAGIDCVHAVVNNNGQVVITCRDGNLEVSNTKRIVSGVSRDTTTVVTSSNHGFRNGDQIEFNPIEGMFELDVDTAVDTFFVETIDDDSFYVMTKDSTGVRQHVDGTAFAQFLVATSQELTGEVEDPRVNRNDSIVINGDTIVFREGDIDTIVDDINNANDGIGLRDVVASNTNGYLKLTTTGVDIELESSTSEAIANITKITVNQTTNDVTVTAPSHGLGENQTVYITGVTGMTDVDGIYIAANVTEDTFVLYEDIVTPINGSTFGTYTNTTPTVLGDTVENNFVDVLANLNAEFSINGHAISLTSGTGSLADIIDDINARSSVTGVTASAAMRELRNYLHLTTTQDAVDQSIVTAHRTNSAGGRVTYIEDVSAVDSTTVQVQATGHGFIDGTYVIINGVQGGSAIEDINTRWVVQNATTNTFDIFISSDSTGNADTWALQYNSGGVISNRPLDLFGISEATVLPDSSGTIYNDVLTKLGLTDNHSDIVAGVFTFDLTVPNSRRLSYVYTTVLDGIGIPEGVYAKANRRISAEVSGTAVTPRLIPGATFWIDDGYDRRTVWSRSGTYTDIDDIVNLINDVLQDETNKIQTFTVRTANENTFDIAWPIGNNGNYDVVGVTLDGSALDEYPGDSTSPGTYEITGQTLTVLPATTTVGDNIVVTLSRRTTSDSAGPIDVVASNSNGRLKLTGGVGTSFELGTDDTTVGETGLNNLYLTASTYTGTANTIARVEGSTRVDDSTSEYTADDSVEGGTLTINGVDIAIAAGSSLEQVVEAINTASGLVGITASVEYASPEYYLVIEGEAGYDIVLNGDSDVLADLGLSAVTEKFVYESRAEHTSAAGSIELNSTETLDINGVTVVLSDIDSSGKVEVTEVISAINNANIENIEASKNTNGEVVIKYFGNVENNQELCIEHTSVASITNIVDNGTLEITTSQPHGLEDQDEVIIQNVQSGLGELINDNKYYVQNVSSNLFRIWNNTALTNAVVSNGIAFVSRTVADVSGDKLIPSIQLDPLVADQVYINDFAITIDNTNNGSLQSLDDFIDRVNFYQVQTGVVASKSIDNQIVLTGQSTDIKIQNGPGTTILEDLGLDAGVTESKMIGSVSNPIVTSGYDIVINGVTVQFAGGDHNNIIDDINNAMFNQNVTNIVASFDPAEENRIVIAGTDTTVDVIPGSQSRTVAIEGIYETNPIRIVAYNHGLVEGQTVKIDDIVPLDSLQAYPLNTNTFKISSVTQDTFVLDGVDGTDSSFDGREYPNAIHTGTGFEPVQVGDKITINGKEITFTRDSNNDGAADINDVITDINSEFVDQSVIASRVQVNDTSVVRLTGYGVNVSVSADSETDQYYNIDGISTDGVIEFTASSSTFDSSDLADLGICLRIQGITDSTWDDINFENSGVCYYGELLDTGNQIKLYESYNHIAVVEGNNDSTGRLDLDDSTDDVVAGEEFYINDKLITISSGTAQTQSMSDVVQDILSAGIVGLSATTTSDDRLQLTANQIIIAKTGESNDEDILEKLGLVEGTTNGEYSDPVSFASMGGAYTGGEGAQAVKKITDQLGIAGTEFYSLSGGIETSAIIELGMEGSTNVAAEASYTQESNASTVGTIANPTVVVGNTIKINGRSVRYTGEDLNTIVSDINNAMILPPQITITAFNDADRLLLLGRNNIDIVVEEHLHGLNAVTDLGIQPGTYGYTAPAPAVLVGHKPAAEQGESIYVNGVHVEFYNPLYITDVVSQINNALDQDGRFIDIVAMTENNELSFRSSGSDIILSNTEGDTVLQDRFGLEPGVTKFATESVAMYTSVFDSLGIEPGCYPVTDGFDDVGSGIVLLASSTTKKGFFGVDKGTNRFTYIPDASIEDNQVEFWEGSKGDVHFGKIYADDGICSYGNIEIEGELEVQNNVRLYKNLYLGDGDKSTPPTFTVERNGEIHTVSDAHIEGFLRVDGNVQLGDTNTDRVDVRGHLGVDVHATLRSANVEDLTSHRVVFSESIDNGREIIRVGELVDDANFSYNRLKLDIGQGNVELFNTGDVNLQGNLWMANPAAGKLKVTSIGITSLTHTRVPFVNEFDELIDDVSMRYFVDDVAYNNVPTLQLTGDINVDTQATLASANVEDLTMHRIVFVGDDTGELVDDANLMWDTSTFYVNGRAEIDNIEIDGNKITTLGNCASPSEPERVTNIVNASNTNPIVITTATDHGYRNGDTISISGVDADSMFEISGRSFEVIASSGTSFSLRNEDGRNYNGWVPTYDFYFLEGPELTPSRLANMPAQSRIIINGRNVTLTNPTNLRQIILDIGTDDQGVGAPTVGANIPGVRAKIWKGLATTGTGTGDENTALVLQVDKNIANSVTIEEHPRDAQNDGLYNAGWTPKVLGFVPGVYSETSFTEISKTDPSNPTQTGVVTSTEALNAGGGFSNGTVLELNSNIEVGNRMTFPFSWIKSNVIDKLILNSGKIVIGTTGTRNNTISSDLANFESNKDLLYPRVEFSLISSGYRMSIIHNDRLNYTNYDYVDLNAVPDTGGLAFEVHDNFISLLASTNNDSIEGYGSYRYNEPPINFWAEHYRSLTDTDTAPVGRTDTRGIRMFIGATQDTAPDAAWLNQPLSVDGVLSTRPFAPAQPAVLDVTSDASGRYFYVVGSNTDIEVASNLAVWVNNTKVVFSGTSTVSTMAGQFNNYNIAGVEWINTLPNGITVADRMVLRVDRTVVSELEISEDAYSTVVHGAVTGPSALYPYNDTTYMGFDVRAGVRYGLYTPVGYSEEVTINEEATWPNIVSTATPTATRAAIPESSAGCHLILDTDPTDPSTRIHNRSVAVFEEGVTAITMIEASDFIMMDNQTPSNIVYTIDGNTGNVVTQGNVTIEDTLTVNRALNSTHPTTGSIQTAGGLGVEMDAWIGGSLYVVGDSIISGNLQLGDQDTDTITFSADVVSSILPDLPNTFDLGNAQKSWRRLHLDDSLNFEGANQQNHIFFPTNLEDGLSISSELVDFMSFESTSSDPKIHVYQNICYRADMEIVGQTSASSLNVEDLTEDRIVIVGEDGELEDDSNFVFDGVHLRVGVTPTTSLFTVEVADGDVYTAGTLHTDGQATLASANVEDLTDNRIVIAGINGELEDDENFTFDATTFNIGQGEFTVDVATGNTDIDGTLDVAGDTHIESTTATTHPTEGALIVDGGTGIVGDLQVGGDIHGRSDLIVYNNTVLGDDEETDTITFTAKGASDLLVNADDAYDLGDATNMWANVFAHVYNGDDAIFGNIQIAVTDDNRIDTVTGELTLDSAAGKVNVDDNLDVIGIATFENVQQSTENNNGSVVIAGGLGVGMNTNIGGELDVDSDAFYHENVHLDDNKELRFGTDIDATAQWDTISNTLRVETTSTTVNSDYFEVSKTDRTELMITADADASVDLYYNGSRKAHTTPEGFTVENQLAADVNFDVHASSETLDSEIHFTAPGMTTATIIADHNATSTDRNLRLAAAGAENIAIVDDRVFLHGDIDNDRTAQLLGDVMVGKTSQAGNTLGIIGGTGDAQISFYESSAATAHVFWDNSENKLVLTDTRYAPTGAEGVFNLTHQDILLWTQEVQPAGSGPIDGIALRDPSNSPSEVVSISNQSASDTDTLLRLSKNDTGEQITIKRGSADTGYVGVSTSDNDLYIEGNEVGIRFDDSLTAVVPGLGQGADADNQFDLGDDTNKWRDIHFGNEVVHPNYTETADTANPSGTARTVIAEFSAATFDAAKFIVKAAHGSERSVTEMLVVHDGTTADSTQYAVINTGTTLAQYDVELVGGSVRLLATSTFAGTEYNIVQTLIV